MGVVASLLNIYARNKRYQQQRNAVEQQRLENKEERRREQALSAFQRQQQQMMQTFGSGPNLGYDPMKTVNQLFPE
jgi:fructoselysine-6-P-deglycase FrlB-like protein